MKFHCQLCAHCQQLSSIPYGNSMHTTLNSKCNSEKITWDFLRIGEGQDYACLGLLYAETPT